MKISKEDIFVRGRELFAAQGFKSTNISDITQACGIGVGTFYNYYPAKEKLFLDIVFSESNSLKEQILSQVDTHGEPLTVVQQTIDLLFRGMQESPILREWLNPDIYAKLKKHVAEYPGEDALYGVFRELILRWQNQGRFRADLSPDLILAMFNALSFINLHSQEIGEEHFPQLLNLMVEYVVNGLSR